MGMGARLINIVGEEGDDMYYVELYEALQIAKLGHATFNQWKLIEEACGFKVESKNDDLFISENLPF